MFFNFVSSLFEPISKCFNSPGRRVISIFLMLTLALVLELIYLIYDEEYLETVKLQVREPIYFVVGEDIKKQIEKIRNDPDDIRLSDLYKFSKFCNRDNMFYRRYVKSRDDRKYLELACEKILHDYKESNFGDISR